MTKNDWWSTGKYLLTNSFKVSTNCLIWFIFKIKHMVLEVFSVSLHNPHDWCFINRSYLTKLAIQLFYYSHKPRKTWLTYRISSLIILPDNKCSIFIQNVGVLGFWGFGVLWLQCRLNKWPWPIPARRLKTPGFHRPKPCNMQSTIHGRW